MAASHEQYLQKSAGPRLIEAKPHPGLRMVVIIPCHDEPDLIGALKHLANCEPSLGQAEVIVVINSSEKDDSEVTQLISEAGRRPQSETPVIPCLNRQFPTVSPEVSKNLKFLNYL